MIEIPLTRGAVAFIDEQDYEPVSQHSWCLHGGGYAARGYRKNGKVVIVKMHQLIMGVVPNGMEIDHINGNKLDNRRCNLRFVKHQQNAFNSSKKKKPCGTASRFKGVFWRKDRCKWISRITVDGKKHHLGSFATEEEAADAYNKAALKFFGAYAKLNEISEKGDFNNAKLQQSRQGYHRPPDQMVLCERVEPKVN